MDQSTHISKYYSFENFNYDYSKVPDFTRKKLGVSLNRYIDLLPIKDLRITLMEGNTPLIAPERLRKKFNIPNLFIKDESRNPTLSFKDRESVVLVNYLLENNITEVDICSSGNAAISTSTYCNIANVKCNCYVPQKISDSKYQILERLKANLILKDGTYEDIYRDLADNGTNFNATSGQNIIRGEGDKTIAYEIYEQVGEVDSVIVPCGNGENLANIWKGFHELFSLKLIDQVPKMYGVQIKGAAPLKRALLNNTTHHIITNPVESDAEGIVASESFVSPKAISAIKSSRGDIFEVTDHEIGSSLKEVIELESIIPEFTAGSAFAALKNFVYKDEKIVLINTAGGLKGFQDLMDIINS